MYKLHTETQFLIDNPLDCTYKIIDLIGVTQLLVTQWFTLWHTNMDRNKQEVQVMVM